MCLSCSNEHKNHNIILYQDKIIDEKILRNKMNKFENVINKLKINIEGIIIRLKNIIENMNIIYNINNNILKQYENKNRNYKLLLNLNYMNKYIENEINIIEDKYKYGYNINQLLNQEEEIIQDKILNIDIQNNNNIYNNNNIIIINKQNQDITDEIIYKPNKNSKVKIFGKIFVNNNKQNCKIIYKNKEYEIKAYINDIDKDYNNKDEIKIKLKGINKVNNMSYMFSGCNALSKLPDISKWDTSNVIDMNHMFEYCNALSSLPDISKWDTSKVTDMSYIFSNCYALSKLPDISKWDTSKATNMSYIFYNCNTLSSLPDISKWDTLNVTDMSWMFYNCKKSLNIPSKFKC